MKNKNITRKITQGMYVLTTKNGGCIVDAVSQVSSGDNPLISVAVMKSNNTHELLKVNKLFALTVIGNNTNPEIIKTFGLNSMRDINKFENIEYSNILDVPVINEGLGYMICEVIDSFQNDTHTVFIGRLIEGDITNTEEEPMSYGYYSEHKEELLKIKTLQNKTAWVCTICGYIYYGEVLPDDFKCPWCGVDKSYFEKKN